MDIRRALAATTTIAAATIVGAGSLVSMAHAAAPRDGWASRPEQGRREGRTTQQVVLENASPVPVIFLDAKDRTGEVLGPLWGDDSMPPNGTVIEPGDSVALELTLGHSVTIQLAEPDENPDSRDGCFSYRPATITMHPSAGSTAFSPDKLGSLKFGGRGNTIRIDGVRGGQPDRSRPLTVGCPLGYEPDGGTLVLPGQQLP